MVIKCLFCKWVSIIVYYNISEDWKMSDLEQTQAIYLEDDDEETDEESTEGKKKIVMLFLDHLSFWVTLIS